MIDQGTVRFAWDRRFDSPIYVFGKEPNAWLAAHHEQLADLAGARALAVADGEGRNSAWLAKLGMNVDAFDISPAAISKAKALAAELGVQVNYVEAGQADFDWKPNYYDVVVAIFVQYATPAMRADLFAKIKQSLRPGGRLYLIGYTTKQLDFATGGPRNLDHLYTAQMLMRDFGDMELIELQEFESTLSEGAGHNGPSALVGLVASKQWSCQPPEVP